MAKHGDVDESGDRIEVLRNWNGLNFALGHDGFGRTASISPSTGPSASFAYDVLNRITQLAWSGNNTNVSENLTYDPFTGDVTAIDREIGHFAYGYDPLDQLQSTSYQGSSQLGEAASRGFSYDETGNRVSDTLRGQGQFWNNVLLGDAMASDLTDAQGRLLQRNHSDGSIEQFSYRTDGRLLHYQKRVPGFSNPVVTGDYEYDALDRRVAKQVSEGSIAVSQAYSYLGASDKILEGKAGDGTITLYMDAEGIDEHLGEIAPQGGKVFIRDHLGSVLNADSSGGAGVFGAFGEGLGSTANLTAAEDPVSYGFTGRQLDPESGLYYYRARMYDPATGRFVSEDPIGFGGGDGNLYRYVYGNPLSEIDPSGRCPLCAAVAVGAVVGAAANIIGSYAAGTLTYENALSTAGVGAAAGATAVLTSGAIAAAGVVATAGELFTTSLSSGLLATGAAAAVDIGATALLNSPPAGVTANEIAAGINPASRPAGACGK